jgi:hypothetical protein
VVETFQKYFDTRVDMFISELNKLQTV